MRTKIFIFDVNTLVSAFIVGSHTNTQAFNEALKIGVIVCTSEIWTELTDVFLREKFDRYHPFEDRANFLSLLENGKYYFGHNQPNLSEFAVIPKMINISNLLYPVKPRVS